MSFHGLKLGQSGESIAKKFLKKKRYKFITQNYTTKIGEVDLIFQDKDQLVFVEVKTRTNKSKGRPEEAIGKRKLDHIQKVAHQFMQENPKLPQFARIDAIAIDGKDLIHFENISQ